MTRMTSLKILPFLLLLASPSARADFSYACGNNREKEPQEAEIGLVATQDSVTKLYLKGEEQSEDSVSVRSKDEGVWIVTLDLGEGQGSRRFEFAGDGKFVQEFRTENSGRDRKVGARRKCHYRRSEVLGHQQDQTSAP